jgi:uroporphyrinogen-III synthase
MRLLVTKIITHQFKDRLIQYGFSLEEYPFIKTIPIEIKESKVNEYLIFTSQNAVKYVLNNNYLKQQFDGKKCFCVGEKTKSILEKNGLEVIKTSHNSAELALFISKNYKNSHFSFFCGTQRRVEIEAVLKKAKITLHIHEMYNTLSNSKSIKTQFDGILFFSPSAVKSYFKSNDWNSDSHGFCIGTSTAEILKKYTKKYSIAKSPSESQLLLSILNYETQQHAQK